MEIKSSNFGSEAGHWYNENGLVTEVPNADGSKMVRPTLRHAKKFGLKPSVTGILGIVDKPALNAWKIKEHIRACGYVGARGKNESFDSYCERVAEQMQRFNDHASVGTDVHANIHAYLDNYFLGKGAKIDAVVGNVCDWLRQNFIDKSFISVDSEKPFVCDLGYGGTVDFCCRTQDEIVFVDFKTTDDDKIAQGAKLAYKDSHLAQLAAYDMGTTGAQEAALLRRYINVFIGRLGGEIYVHEWTEGAEIAWAKKYFLAALALFKAAKNLN